MFTLALSRGLLALLCAHQLGYPRSQGVSNDDGF